MSTYEPSVLSGLASVNPLDAFTTPESGNLAVVLCHFNPCAYEAPVKNLKTTLGWLAREKLPTYVVELRCGRSLEAPPVLGNDHPRIVQLTSESSMFRKDNLWNVAARVVPTRFKYILFLDADTILLARNWKEILCEELDKKKIVQPFSLARWTDSVGVAFKEKPSCGYGFKIGAENAHISHFYHSGFAVAVHRRFFEETAGFYNSPIGGGSLFLISAAIGQPCETEPSLVNVAPLFLAHYRRWAEQIKEWTGGSFGVTPGEAIHLWHGSRSKRRYLERFQRLSTFDPFRDIVETPPFGLHEWTPAAHRDKSSMIQEVESYFLTREEDEVFISSNCTS